MASILTNNHYPIGSVCQVVTGWAQQNNATITAGNSDALTYYSLAFTPKFANSLCIYETSVVAYNTSDSGYNRFFVYDTTNGVYLNGPSDYIGTSGYTHTDWIDVPIRTVFTPNHTELMTIKLYMYALTGNGQANWSSSDNRLMSVTEIVQ